jgi:hypothetical protein
LSLFHFCTCCGLKKLESQQVFVQLPDVSSSYWGNDRPVRSVLSTSELLSQLLTSICFLYSRNNGWLTITPDQYNSLQSLFFNISGITRELIPNGQIWPRSLNAEIGGDPNLVYLIVNDLGSPLGSGLDFIGIISLLCERDFAVIDNSISFPDGFGFLQRFYSVYDVTDSQVGFATTAFTDATTN